MHRLVVHHLVVSFFIANHRTMVITFGEEEIRTQYAYFMWFNNVPISTGIMIQNFTIIGIEL